MAFREKIAWLTLATMLIAYGVYFGIIGPSVGFGERHLVDIVWSFGLVAGVHAIAMIVGAIALAVTATREANAGADERDRAIDRRASLVAYYVLLVGMILVAVVMPFSEPSWKIVNAGLVAIVLAEAARHGIILLSYRRGWNG
ncbi:MAG TPA: hypothetical protein VF680_14475 [Allosphingosinicella sp.]|jgi:uncharacterized BrkB/YihY/UPF0761 family membrane protein